MLPDDDAPAPLSPYYKSAAVGTFAVVAANGATTMGLSAGSTTAAGTSGTGGSVAAMLGAMQTAQVLQSVTNTILAWNDTARGPPTAAPATLAPSRAPSRVPTGAPTLTIDTCLLREKAAATYGPGDWTNAQMKSPLEKKKDYPRQIAGTSTLRFLLGDKLNSLERMGFWVGLVVLLVVIVHASTTWIARRKVEEMWRLRRIRFDRARNAKRNVNHGVQRALRRNHLHKAHGSMRSSGETSHGHHVMDNVGHLLGGAMLGHGGGEFDAADAQKNRFDEFDRGKVPPGILEKYANSYPPVNLLQNTFSDRMRFHGPKSYSC